MIRINDKIVELLNEQEELLLEQQYHCDEFLWIIRTNKPIVLERETNEIMYDKLDKIMSSNYIFQEGIPSQKTKNKLVWLSDQYCNLEDEDALKRINRLIIEKINDAFHISVHNPFLEELKINKNIYVIAFSPLFNGYFSRNQETGLTLQDDFAIMFNEILHNNPQTIKRLKN